MSTAIGEADAKRLPFVQKEPENSVPTAPLSYADRLRLGPKASGPKAAPVPSPTAPPAAAAPPAAIPKAAEPAAETADVPEASTTAIDSGVV